MKYLFKFCRTFSLLKRYNFIYNGRQLFASIKLFYPSGRRLHPNRIRHEMEITLLLRPERPRPASVQARGLTVTLRFVENQVNSQLNFSANNKFPLITIFHQVHSVMAVLLNAVNCATDFRANAEKSNPISGSHYREAPMHTTIRSAVAYFRCSVLLINEGCWNGCHFRQRG